MNIDIASIDMVSEVNMVSHIFISVKKMNLVTVVIKAACIFSPTYTVMVTCYDRSCIVTCVTCLGIDLTLRMDLINDHFYIDF